LNIKNPHNAYMINEENKTLIRQKFDDFDHLLEVLLKWNLNFKQLDRGNFSGELFFVDHGGLQVSLSSFNRKFDQEGSSPSGYRTFAILASVDQQIIWRGKQVSGKNLLVFPETNELDALSYPGFRVYTIAISNEKVKEFLNVQNLNEQKVFQSNEGIVTPGKRVINDIRHQLEYLTWIVNENPKGINSSAFHQIFTKEIPSMILNSVITEKSIVQPSTLGFRKQRLHKALEYLKSCEDEMPTVQELCLITETCQRTIEYAFKEKYGFGPKEYMKKLSLNHVRNALKSADPDTATIKHLAGGFGFWHMGQFSADYKKLFCESPSETLREGK